MSEQTLNAFISALNSNEALAEGLVAAIGDSEGQPAYAAVSQFADRNGYTVSVDEARQAHTSYVDSATGGALVDDDLENVSGGMFQPGEMKAAHELLKQIFKGW